MVNCTKDNITNFMRLRRINTQEISRIVGSDSVLNIRADQSIYYLSKIKTFDKYLFYSHVDVLFKQNAWQYYLTDLKKKPKFVITPYEACGYYEIEQPVCAWIDTHYHSVYSMSASKHHKDTSINLSYTLYQINDSDQGPTRANGS